MQVIDAFTLQSVADGKITVELVSKDKDKLYTLEGSKTFKIQNGFVSIGVLKRDTPTANKPLDFMLVFKPNNSTYLENRQIFSVINGNEPQIQTVRMLDKATANSFAGIKVEETTFTTNANGTTAAPLNIATSNMPENTKVTLPANTVLRDKDGNPVTGTVTATMVSFNATDTNALSNFPGGLAFTNARDSAGNNAGGGTFTTFGFISLSMSAGGKEIKSFSQPLDVSVEVSPDIKRDIDPANPARATQVGDVIPIWSMNDSTTEWQAETAAQVVLDPVTGKMKANFKQTHLSWWNLDDPPCPDMFIWFYQRFILRQNVPFVSCATCDNAAVKFQTPAYINSSYYTEISSPTNPDMSVKRDFINYTNNNVLSFTNYLGGGKTKQNLRLIFKIFNKEPWNGGTAFYTSPTPVRPCDAPALLDLRNVTFPQTMNLNANFSFNCPDRRVAVKPTVTLYYKEISPTSDRNWNFLGLMRNGEGRAEGKLQGGRKYKFAIFHGNLNFTTDDLEIYQNGVKVNAISIPQNLSDDISFRFVKAGWNLDQTITLTRDNANRTYDFTMVFNASAELCQRYRKYF